MCETYCVVEKTVYLPTSLSRRWCELGATFQIIIIICQDRKYWHYILYRYNYTQNVIITTLKKQHE